MTVTAKAFAGNILGQHWLPFTSNRDFKPGPRLLARGTASLSRVCAAAANHS